VAGGVAAGQPGQTPIAQVPGATNWPQATASAATSMGVVARS